MRVIIASLAIALAGCATTKTNYSPKAEQISFPALGEETEVAIGDAMLKQGTFTEVDGIVLPAENNIGGYIFSDGFYPKVGEDEKYTFHTYQNGRGLNGYGGMILKGGLLGPQYNDVSSLRATKGTNEVCAVRSLGIPKCDTEIGYSVKSRPAVNENDFQQTLLYNGRVGDKVKIGYREFSGGMARAPFSNEVEYDLSTSDIITYKGARIRIIKADNTSIRYVVVSNFNDAN